MGSSRHCLPTTGRERSKTVSAAGVKGQAGEVRVGCGTTTPVVVAGTDPGTVHAELPTGTGGGIAALGADVNTRVGADEQWRALGGIMTRDPYRLQGDELAAGVDVGVLAGDLGGDDLIANTIIRVAEKRDRINKLLEEAGCTDRISGILVENGIPPKVLFSVSRDSE